ncbi:MAG: dockerin type I domain-containing protein, partial [Candidatus Poribacteria bacterium]|nr:dockerin type I domain-containing protein [Candidatus Poribacteria bacterium]
TPVYSVMLAGVGDLTTETPDASAGISYTLKVTNNGNTDDVINLATLDEAATLSQTSVSLASGASAEVTLTISADALAIAGKYDVIITATSQGDDTKTAEITTTTTITPVYSVMLAGVGSLTTKTADASEGVTYTLKVTNIGNTDDIIDLATSDNATLSQASVSLASGASAEVILTIAGDVLANAGNYEVKATATSQGDDTKTAEVATTTTILPVYDVSLAGVGSLTTKTADASVGVTYTLIITNTGNTSDTINLATSENAATLSQTSVSLASKASTNVTLTIPGTALATAGEYGVTVTATSQGDNTKTAEIKTTTTITPVYSVMLAGVGDLTTETADASQGVTYMINVTNIGNTDDIIDLATSDNATLSQASVSLASGASAEVILTIAGDVLANAGNYEVKVTATSQGDNTKTAEVATTTTILPVYGVMINGVGALAKSTVDADDGINYTLRVINTGNTDDIIDLATSDDSATLSQTAISLASGASAEVILTVSSDVLATAGKYDATVTATSQGDNTKTAQITAITTNLPVYGVMLAGVGDLTTETTDASEGVTYMLTITNIGNTDDIIDLATSDNATLSQTSVSLASGASAEVVLAIAGDVLANAGNYEVKVTATSQGDNTKTAEISTTTTILPVYSLSLAGVGDLTTETADASAGVTYMINVTNIGNTDDIIDLATSDNATLSQTSVSLASGASAEVVLAIAGDVLANAGNYEVKVTATSQGDNTKTAEVATTTTILPAYDVMLAGEGALTGTTMDTVAGVTYTLIVTNTGNTDDTISLSSSAEVGIGGSVLGSFRLPDTEEPATGQLEIMLGAGASANVMFTASGDLLTKPGEYEIKVTATSQGDNTKTAEVATKTTILPVYGVMLAGVDDLTTETADASQGVTYTITITNTGNTSDTINLATSDDSATLSQTAISLASGASAEVVLTIAGGALSTAGDYEVKVTATSQGDNTKTAEVATKTTILPVYGITLIGEGDLKGETMDTLAGVDYTLTITNTGNTDDTIVLSSSAEIGIEGSVLGSFRQSDDQVPMGQLEIELAAGASAEITFTAAGDFFTKPGEYEIKVTATSQTDNTKTAEITTVTTIKPVPSDINADGTVNIQDLVLVANQIGESGEGLSGDVNMDGEVNILDLVQVTSYFGKTQAEIVQANQ